MLGVARSPGTVRVIDTPSEHMIRDDRDTVRHAARTVREAAIRDQYAGLGSPAQAFAMR